MNEPNRIVLTKRDFKDDETLFKKVGEAIRILLESDNIIVAFDADDKDGVIIIEYVHDDTESIRPIWLTEDEYSYVSKYHDEQELDFHKKKIKELTGKKDEDYEA